MSSANNPDIKVCIQELQKMHKVAEEDIDVITRPTEIFTQPKKINPTELDDNRTPPD